MSDVSSGLPGQLDSDDGPTFRELWEAQAFAMALALHQRGFFDWSEWAQVLAAVIVGAQAAGDPDLGDTYYRHWLTALERLVIAKDASSVEEVTRYQCAWGRAAHRTPHGHPLELQPEDFSR